MGPKSRASWQHGLPATAANSEARWSKGVQGEEGFRRDSCLQGPKSMASWRHGLPACTAGTSEFQIPKRIGASEPKARRGTRGKEPKPRGARAARPGHGRDGIDADQIPGSSVADISHERAREPEGSHGETQEWHHPRGRPRRSVHSEASLLTLRPDPLRAAQAAGKRLKTVSFLTDKLKQATNRLARAIPEEWLIDLTLEA